MNRSFQQFLERKQREWGVKFDPKGLNPDFVPYYENQKRIEVDFGDGEIKRGRIGITTGFIPVFLLLLTRRSVGSHYLIRPTSKILREIV